jgi:PhzF family phenazine biosynthesis protein
MVCNLVRVVHTRVFAAGVNGGNLCPVVPFANGLSDEQMLALAQRFGLDTAFIQPPSVGSHLRIRYFVPTHEMGVSGHATLAAITVALQHGLIHNSRLLIETKTGIFESACEVGGDDVVVTLDQRAPVFSDRLTAVNVATVLGIDQSKVADHPAPVQVVSVSRPKLIVPLSNERVLNRLRPHHEALWALCDAHGASGLYAFTTATARDIDAEARQFPVRAGFAEDAATGVAAAALGAYIVYYYRSRTPGTHVLRIAQGYAMGCPSRIQVLVESKDGTVTRTAIRGTASVIREEEVAV